MIIYNNNINSNNNNDNDNDIKCSFKGSSKGFVVFIVKLRVFCSKGGEK